MSALLTRDELERRYVEPVLALEMRRFGKRGLWWAASAGVMMAAGATVATRLCVDGEYRRVAVMVAAFVYVFVIYVVTPAYGARSISRERDSGTWDMLSITPMGSGQIADQKILSAAMPMLVVLAAGLPAGVIATATGGVTAFEAMAIGVAILLSALILSCWSVESSSDCGSGTTATAVAYAPMAQSVCILGYLVSFAILITALVLLINSATRARTWRVVGAGLCMQLGQGACALPIVLLAGRFFPFAVSAIWVPGGLLVQALALVGMRCILARSIERQRTTI